MCVPVLWFLSPWLRARTTRFVLLPPFPARCWEKGDIYAADYEGWYCVDCEEFKVRPHGGRRLPVTRGSNRGMFQRVRPPEGQGRGTGDSLRTLCYIPRCCRCTVHSDPDHASRGRNHVGRLGLPCCCTAAAKGYARLERPRRF